MKDDMLTLAARVEALDGADREVDCLIELSCGPDAPAIQRIMAGSIHNTIDEVAKAADREGGLTFFRIPRYTASIDAAMTLVPDGWVVGEMSWWPHARSSTVHMDDMHDRKACSGAQAPALALCAASLRARSSMGGK